MCLCESMSILRKTLRKAEQGSKFSAAGLTGRCEQPEVHAEK